LAPLVNKIIILDHHKTGFELINKLRKEHKLPHNSKLFAICWFLYCDTPITLLEITLFVVEAVYVMEKSGATIAYEYFNKEKQLVKDDQLRK
jgi:hypothetical protein